MIIANRSTETFMIICISFLKMLQNTSCLINKENDAINPVSCIYPNYHKVLPSLCPFAKYFIKTINNKPHHVACTSN